jgi:Peptidase A4 family
MPTTRIAGRFLALAATTMLAGASMAGPAVAGGSVFAPFHASAVGGKFAAGNWGGYAATGTFTSATASWTLPAVTCTSDDELYAPWVGLDGYSTSTVEQTGVAADCSSGSLQWEPWYEMYPSAPVYFTETVKTGDSFTGTVTALGSGKYTLVLADTTQGWSKTFNETLKSGKNASAEAIVESPPDAYPKFASQIFTNVEFNGKTLKSFNPTKLTAENGSGTVVPGAINSAGTGFTLTQKS